MVIVLPSALYQSIWEALGDRLAEAAEPHRAQRGVLGAQLQQPSRGREDARVALVVAPRQPGAARESWQYALLLPRWVRPNSSPAVSIGTPADSSRVPSRFRMVRRRGRADARVVGARPRQPWL